MTYDYSTINIARLRALPIYKLPPTYQLQDDPGNGCAGDPPGYPSYFTRSVYTQYGNYPPRGAQEVIANAGTLRITRHGDDWKKCKGWDSEHAKYEERLRKLWKPLPLNHPRTRAWIAQLYKHFQHCYADYEELEYGKPGTLIYPVPNYKLKVAHIDKHWTEEYKQIVRAEAEAHNQMIIERATRIATVDNHLAVVRIREFYPEYEPELDLIKNPPPSPGNWWERYAEPFKPEDCPGQYGHKHPVNGSWCQMCGWRSK